MGPSNNLRSELIGFRTNGTWTANEWCAMLGSISSLYDLLLSIRIAGELGQIAPESLPRPTAHEVYFNRESFFENEQRLTVQRVKLGSPGGFCFTGSGEIVRELRKLILDIAVVIPMMKSYQGVIREVLKMLNKKNPVLDSVDRELLKEVVESVRNLIELVNSGKLEDIGDNIRYIPD